MSVGKKKKDTLLPLPFTLKERTYTDFRRNEPSFVMVKKKKEREKTRCSSYMNINHIFIVFLLILFVFPPF